MQRGRGRDLCKGGSNILNQILPCFGKNIFFMFMHNKHQFKPEKSKFIHSFLCFSFTSTKSLLSSVLALFRLTIESSLICLYFCLRLYSVCHKLRLNLVTKPRLISIKPPMATLELSIFLRKLGQNKHDPKLNHQTNWILSKSMIHSVVIWWLTSVESRDQHIKKHLFKSDHQLACKLP